MCPVLKSLLYQNLHIEEMKLLMLGMQVQQACEHFTQVTNKVSWSILLIILIIFARIASLTFLMIENMLCSCWMLLGFCGKIVVAYLS